MSEKGSEFEREIAKKLGLWWTAGARDDIFWRTSTSGAWAHNRRKSGKATFGQTGDLQAIDPLGQPFFDLFCIELKRGYKRWDLLDLLDHRTISKKSTLLSFLVQTFDQAKLVNRVPLLIAKRDRKSPVAILPGRVWRYLTGSPTGIALNTLLPAFVVVSLDSFLHRVHPNWNTAEADMVLMTWREVMDGAGDFLSVVNPDNSTVRISSRRTV